MQDEFVEAEFAASVTPQGRLVFDEPMLAVSKLLRLFHGKRVSVVVMREKRRRTSAQERLVRSYYKLIAEQSGHTPDEVHDGLVRLLLPKDLVFPGGVILKAVREPKDLEVPEFSAFIDRVRLWALEQGYQLPLPGESWEVVSL